jgi:hypothetical protein
MLAQFGKLDDLGGDDFGGRIGGVGKPKQPAGILERDAHGPRDLGLEGMVLEKWSDRQSAAPDGPSAAHCAPPHDELRLEFGGAEPRQFLKRRFDDTRSGIEPQTGYKRLTPMLTNRPWGRDARTTSMTVEMNARRSAAGLMLSVWLGFAGNAQAGIIIIEDPLSPPDQVLYASYGACVAGHADRWEHAFKKLRAKSAPPAVAAAAPATLVSQPDFAPPARVARVSAGAALIVGVAF